MEKWKSGKTSRSGSPGKELLPSQQLKDFRDLVELLADEIVQSWVNYFVYHKKIIPKKIQGKLK